jgi:hypothetical protein
MPEKVTIEEKLVELAIEKAKEVKVLQEANEERLLVDEPIEGETVKLKKPKAKKDKDRSKELSIEYPAKQKVKVIKRDEEAERLEDESYSPKYDRDASFSLKDFANWLIKEDTTPDIFFNTMDDDYQRKELNKIYSQLMRAAKNPLGRFKTTDEGL